MEQTQRKKVTSDEV